MLTAGQVDIVRALKFYSVIMNDALAQISVMLYRHAILGLDVTVFLLKTVGEYIRLTYRSFVPRPLKDISGEVRLRIFYLLSN